MSGWNSKRSIDQEIDHVRECIERCIQMYMNKRETVKFLATHGNIKPAITRIVWSRLERDNPEFFRAYYVRLAVQDQIIEFNKLLPLQAELMRQTGLAGNAGFFEYTNPSRTGQRVPTTPNMQQHLYASNDNGPSTHACMQGNLDDRSSYYVSPDDKLLSRNSNVVSAQTGNEQIVLGGHSNFVESNFSDFNNSDGQHLEDDDDDFVLDYGLLEQYQQTCGTEYPIDSSGSSELSQHLDDFLFKCGVLEQYQPISIPEYQMDASTRNVELMDPGSSGSLRNPFFG
ncbi:hypothetical protein OROMI_015536 [Orobanche minor]